MALTPEQQNREQEVREKILEILESRTSVTIKEIQSQTGTELSLVRNALASLAKKSQIVSFSEKPVRYRLAQVAQVAQKRAPRDPEREWYGAIRQPYYRPGSYTPPDKPRVRMFGADLEDGQ
jgi:hypothetical protein